MQPNLLDGSLSAFKESNEDVVLSLRDGGRITGRIRDFDTFVVLVAGEPDTMVYRHSIMKLLPASSGTARPDKSSVKKPQHTRPQKTGPAREQKKPAAKSPKDGGRDKPAPQPDASSAAGFSNPMADALQKWIESQKGGE